MHYTNLGNRENKLDNSNHEIKVHNSTNLRAKIYNEEKINSLASSVSKKK